MSESVKGVLKKVDFSPSKEEFKDLKREVSSIVKELKKGINNLGIKASVFVGGSYAKGTLLKEKEYDVDVFVRFERDDGRISEDLARILKRAVKEKVRKVHGSRDYFSISIDDKKIEVIPVLKIKKPIDAKNVTDISYFHVNYIRKKAKKSLLKDVMMAKKFFKASKVYGAESYIQGFSGYSIEILTLHYGGFEKMIRALAKLDAGKKNVIDPEKMYKNRAEALIDLNESKVGGPIVLVDPTWRERNALAALNKESFVKLQDRIKKFLKKPSVDYFIEKGFNRSTFSKKAKGKNMEFLELEIETKRQEGDIAGTKMKKFARILVDELDSHFCVKNKEFVYVGGKTSLLFLILEKRENLIIVGPEIGMAKHALEFRKKHKKVFVKKGKLHAKKRNMHSGKRFIEDWKKSYGKKIKDMGISGLKVRS
tara:strand:+ start:4263 stop:5537 length:1275 start_codon:yes stop_codon:yes gene_type:complete